MRVLFVGGTGFLGPVAARLALEAGHEVLVAHRGETEPLAPLDLEHLHGSRDDLLAPGGPVEASRPDAIVDTFHGATGAKAEAVAACAERAGVQRLIAISSCDVYQAGVDAGLGDGSGFTLLPRNPLPIDEDAPRRQGPYPGAAAGHDNVEMEDALRDASVPVTILRPGAIYGIGDTLAREWPLVDRIRRGEHRLPLPGGGATFFHRVAVERVGRAILAALTRAPSGWWPCNVVDPYDWTYAGLAAEIASILDWEWQPEAARFSRDNAHPFMLRQPLIISDRRLREVLGVTEPDPRAALRETILSYWEHGPRPGALYEGGQLPH